MGKKLCYYFIFLALLLVSSCATNMQNGCVKDNWDNYYSRVTKLSNWQSQGKIIVYNSSRYDKLSFNWQETSGHANVTLFGPIGVSIATITEEADGANIVTIADKNATSLQRYLTVNLALDLDISLLKDILLAKAIVANDYPSKLLTRGLDVSWENFACWGNLYMPKTIIIRRSKTTYIKIIFTNWQIDKN